MPRRRVATKRSLSGDPKYGETLVSRFVNVVMKDGKKSTAEGLFYRALDIVGQKTKKDPMEVFKQAVENVKPFLEVKSRRVGGSTYQIPVEVKSDRRAALSIRWLIDSARGRGERGFFNKLAGEIMDAANNTGSSVKKKEDTHKMAEANKAFSHYKW
ncbi:MAG: 30S ribosomal protein S7 [Nitrospinae bacterium]|nr:30S ribosomal protein S7 [Nitrospinota bacterium]